MLVSSFIQNKWIKPKNIEYEIYDAIFGNLVGELGGKEIDLDEALKYGREATRRIKKLTFTERAKLLNKLASYLNSRKEELYELSYSSGATRRDSYIDIDGGIGTTFVFASKALKELPNEKIWVEGKVERLSKDDSFIGQHILTALEGVAVHINAFNFPCWGLLEKFAPSFIAGMASIVKPAPQTAHITNKLVRLIQESEVLPDGSIQLFCGKPRELLDYLDFQDVLTFTGSASTALKVKKNENLLNNNIRLNIEADSLNCALLGDNISFDSKEYSLFLDEVEKEVCEKAGQKCTAIRRVIVPEKITEKFSQDLKARLLNKTIGNPRLKDIDIGGLVSKEQQNNVQNSVNRISESNDTLIGNITDFSVIGADLDKGSFFHPTVFICPNPLSNQVANELEAFGPVTTIFPYKNWDQAINIAKMGKGSLVASVFSDSDEEIKQFVYETASHNGRVLLCNKSSFKASTGHGAALPHLNHGGPGRAGGGEELGGLAAVKRYMQKTALQGHPSSLKTATGQWFNGGKRVETEIHPFHLKYDSLKVGDCFKTARRTITEGDISNFAGISGDYFYAHVDEIAAQKSEFGKRIAHGYFLISAAAGLFVDPKESEVIANYGIEKLRFIQPVFIGDTIRANLTCKQKREKKNQDKDKETGVIIWNVEIVNQKEDLVALLDILTIVKK